MSAIPFVRISKEQLRENKGLFSLVRGTAIRGRVVNACDLVEIPTGLAQPFYVINNAPEYKIGDHIYHQVEGDEALPMYEVSPDTPLTGYTVVALYLENEPRLVNNTGDDL